MYSQRQLLGGKNEIHSKKCSLFAHVISQREPRSGLRPPHVWSTHLGIESNVQFRMDRCTVPAASELELDFQNAASSWVYIVGAHDRFLPITSGNTNCSANLQGNGLQDFQTTTSLPNGSALAWYTGFPTSTCSDAEWDVLISPNGFAGGACNELGTTPCRRAALVHELGHVLGLGHETSGKLATMAAFTPQGLLGGDTWHRSGPFADDAAYAMDYHGDGLTSFDAAVSPWMRSGNQSALTHPSDTIISGCSGAAVSFTYSWTNRGTQTIPSGSPAVVRYYLSTDETISTSDILWGSLTVWGTKGWSATYSPNLTIPSSLSLNTVYRIGVIIDPLNAISESNESNNVTRINRRIRRIC